MGKNKIKDSKTCINFNALGRAEKRVAIAKDVIAQIKAKRFVASAGIYVALKGNKVNLDDVGDQQVNKLIANEKVTCMVCAKGALFMSHVMKTNHLNVDEMIVDESFVSSKYGARNSTCVERLEKFFSNEQLELIECAFERGNHGDPIRLWDEAYEFGDKFDDDEDRLIAICKNIIKNKGTFKP